MTPGTAFLNAKEVPFTEHTYDYVEHGGTEVPARSLGVPEHQIVKTLVMEDDAKKPLHQEPRAPGRPQVRRALRILELPEIYINGGRRGLLVRMRSADLARVLSVTPVDVALS